MDLMELQMPGLVSSQRNILQKPETLLFFISVQTKVGTWNSLDKLNLARVEEATTGDGIDHPMANKTFVIVGVLVNYSQNLFPSGILNILFLRIRPTQCMWNHSRS